MSELVICYYSGDEPLIAPILKHVGELGIEATVNPVDNAEPVALEQLLHHGIILLCWSPALVAANLLTGSGAIANGRLISCLIAPCQTPSTIDATKIASLIGWLGRPDAPLWLGLIAQIAGILQRPGLIELSNAVASGEERALHAFARRYPDEPVAKEIWKHRETKHRQAFEHSLAFARANFDRRVRMDWKKIEDMLRVYKTEFEIWLEEERLGNSKILVQPNLLTIDNTENFDSAGQAEAKAASLADQLAREYSRRRELSDRAVRLEVQLQQSEAEATLKLQMANREIETIYKQAQSTEREHAAVVVERNILSHGQAALRSELLRLRTTPRRFRVLASVLLAAAVISGSLTSRFWPQPRVNVARQDTTLTAPNSVSNSLNAAHRISSETLTKENVEAAVNEAMRVAPGVTVSAISRSARGDLFAGVSKEDLSLFANRIALAIPQQIVAEVIRAIPTEVVDRAIQAKPELVASAIVKAAPEAVLHEMGENAAFVAQIVANYPAAISAELLRSNPLALVAPLAKSRPELVLSEILKSAPDALIEKAVRAYPNAVADLLLKTDSTQFMADVVKLMPDRLLAELLRTNSDQVVAQVVQNSSGQIMSELSRADPNSLIAAALKLDAAHVIGEAAKLAPDVLISEALRSNLSAVALQATKMAPASLIAEIVKIRSAELTSLLAKNYPDATTAELLKYSPDIVVAELLRTKFNFLTAKMMAAEPLVTSDIAKPAPHNDVTNAPASDPTRSGNSELVSTNQSSVTTETIGQASSDAVRNVVNQSAKPADSSGPVPLFSSGQANQTLKDCELCPKLVTIPAGTSFIGLRGDEKLSSDISDRSEHGKLVSLAAPFALSEGKITVAEFKSFLLQNHRTESSAETCRRFAGRSGQRNAQLSYLYPGFEQGDNHPVVCVSWNDAVEYTQWLSEKTGKHYRLPTEAEWEYAARTANHDEWRAGESLSESCRYGNILDVSAVARKVVAEKSASASCSDQWAYTSPQGAFPANGFGLFDMYGNAHEWVQDCWNEDLSTLPANGSARNSDNSSSQCTSGMRVRRGSAWTTPPSASGLAARWKGTENHAFQDTGFRVLRELN